MLQLPSGNELLAQSFEFAVNDASHVGEARRFANTLAEAIGLDENTRGRLGIVVTELATNLYKHAKSGRLVIRALREGGVEILSVDKGPGIANVALSLQDGYSTGGTPGTGLGAIRRQSDDFDIFSSQGRGTVIRTQVGAKRRRPTEAGFEVGAICIALEGETVCGDGWSSREDADHLSLLVADGLGHGHLAHKAALEAIETFQQSSNESADLMIKRVHGRLKGTRGAAVFALNVENGKVAFSGLGNIRATVVAQEKVQTLISQNGTAGLQMRTAQELSAGWKKGDLLVVHSDGVSSRWNLDDYPGLRNRHPSVVAAVLHRDFSRGSDDATVIVGRQL